MIRFLKEAQAELAKVHWPSKKEAFRLTRYVIFASLIVGSIVAILDVIFKAGLEVLLLK